MADLLLDSLEIQNFRAFRHLKIERLGRVNLITGKNNVGKTCLLEALWLYATRGDPKTMIEMLTQRGEWSGSGPRPAALDTQLRYDGITNLFHGRKNILSQQGTISLGQIADDGPLMIKVLPYVWQNRQGVNQLSPVTPAQHNAGNMVPTLEVYLPPSGPMVFPLDSDYANISMMKPLGIQYIPGAFVPAYGLSPIETNKLWDAISLTEEENHVLQSLQIIAPTVTAINLRGDHTGSSERSAFVRDETSPKPLPLRSMGDGMNRLFGIALALVNAKDGMLLIDEVETGLHYSVISDVWRLIFEVAHRLNVQVFATTHSWDCIQAFEQAASENKMVDGQLIRLTNKNGKIVEDTFTEKDLAIVTENGIEVR